MNSTTMLTVTGALLDLRRPRAADISILDIAHSLALINRYTGHTSRPYSVAEHSLLVAELMQREYGVRDPAALLAGLLHDAAEAYTGDLGSPMKHLLGWKWADDVTPLEAMVADRFGVLEQTRAWASIIKRCDLMALAMERRDLLPPGGPAWPQLDGIKVCDWLSLSERAGMGWQDWRQAYLDRFAALSPAVQAEAEVAA
jgi:hypothetical protein